MGDYKILLKRYQKSAEKRGLEFSLKSSTFLNLITERCDFCNVKPFQKQGKIKYMGIDRIRNDLGYIDGNVVSCCKYCNYAKGSMPFYEFDAWLERIAEFYPIKMRRYDNNTF